MAIGIWLISSSLIFMMMMMIPCWGYCRIGTKQMVSEQVLLSKCMKLSV